MVPGLQFCNSTETIRGKSDLNSFLLTSCRIAELQAWHHRPVLTVQHTSGSALDLLMHIGDQLGLEGSLIRSRMVRRIQQECAQLVSSHICPLVVVDEAHFLTNQALHELRLTMRSGPDALRNFTLILSGQDDLEGRLRVPWLLPLKQRITTWIRLGPLDPQEASQYLAHRLKIAGVLTNLFSPEATFALCQLSGGFLRPLDTLAHHALLACASEGAKQVSADHVRLAAEEVG